MFSSLPTSILNRFTRSPKRYEDEEFVEEEGDGEEVASEEVSEEEEEPTTSDEEFINDEEEEVFELEGDEEEYESDSEDPLLEQYEIFKAAKKKEKFLAWKQSLMPILSEDKIRPPESRKTSIDVSMLN